MKKLLLYTIAVRELGVFKLIKKMNKGLKAHLYATLLYVIVIIITLFKNNSVTIEVRYILALGFFMIQVGIGILCYLEEYYNE